LVLRYSLNGENGGAFQYLLVKQHIPVEIEMTHPNSSGICVRMKIRGCLFVKMLSVRHALTKCYQEAEAKNKTRNPIH
jgi:hypothetical protein